jgi:hypothetical protein
LLFLIRTFDFVNATALIRTIFYGNYFYGLCAVALSIETLLQQKAALPSPWFFIAVFCVSVVYYSRAYITERPSNRYNDRLTWYLRNKNFIKWSQIILTLFATGLVVLFLTKHGRKFFELSLLEVILIGIFPVTGVFYYGLSGTKYSLRNIGWLKPFVIGFAWAGMVTIYPPVFSTIENEIPFELTVIASLLFLKNFMFVSVLCIMFDIKDYVSDSNQNLGTFVVKSGLRRTIFVIIIPLCLIGLGTFILYGVHKNFHIMRILLNVIPFLLLLITAYSLFKRRNLLFYLIVVDGLMLVKAVCGSVAVVYF